MNKIPALPSESWDTLLSDDGDIPVLEVREIGTGSTQIKGYLFFLEMLVFHNLVLTHAYVCTVEQKMLVGWQIQVCMNHLKVEALM